MPKSPGQTCCAYAPLQLIKLIASHIQDEAGAVFCYHYICHSCHLPLTYITIRLYVCAVETQTVQPETNGPDSPHIMTHTHYRFRMQHVITSSARRQAGQAAGQAGQARVRGQSMAHTRALYASGARARAVDGTCARIWHSGQTEKAGHAQVCLFVC